MFSKHEEMTENPSEINNKEDLEIVIVCQDMVNVMKRIL